MNRAFQKDRAFVLPYFDDIIVFSKSAEEHIKHLEVVFSRLKGINMALNRKKCNFMKSEVKLLGFVVGAGIVKPDPDKIKALKEYKRPDNISELRSFLGLVNYNREFIPKFTELTLPLYNMIKGEQKKSTKVVVWGPNEAMSFSKLKGAISESTSLALPDFTKKFIVITDASHTAIGAVLAQADDNGKERIIHTFSRALDKAQKNYSTTDLELLGIVKSLEHFRHYLLGRSFKLRTDHRALIFLQDCKSPTSRQLRYALMLQDYEYDIEHVKGELNPADSMSRYVGNIQVNTETPLLTVAQRKDILNDYHLALGHGSANAMKFLIKQKYKWASMYRDIEEHVNKCMICLRSGYENKRRGNRAIVSDAPNNLWEIDVVGYLDATKRGNRFLLVAIDHYTKWVEAVPIKAKDKYNICAFVKKHIIEKHGAPQRILTDNGLEFNNLELKSLLSEYGIEHAFSSPGHHETVGAVERVNQTLFNKLKKLCDYGKKPWDLYVAAAVQGVNFSYHRAIQTCPSILKFGILPNMKVDKVHQKIDVQVDLRCITDSISRFSPHYRASDIQKGKTPWCSDIKIGDRVLIFKEQLGKKLANSWLPGFTVVDVVLPDAFIVESNRGKYRINKHHIKLDLSKGGGVSSSS
ncbi:hypothetical protein PAPHI01_0549 [Pancytospora philotis]|nr:hypothetical protein PAPHI01_0549 [Pancytospora philotis]